MNDKIAIYLRLSLADGDLKKGSKDESNSISQIFSNFCGNAAGREVSNKSFAHDKCTSFDRFS